MILESQRDPAGAPASECGVPLTSGVTYLKPLDLQMHLETRKSRGDSQQSYFSCICLLSSA